MIKLLASAIASTPVAHAGLMLDDLSPTFRAAWQAVALVDQAETAVELLSALALRVVDPQRSELRLRVHRLLTRARNRTARRRQKAAAAWQAAVRPAQEFPILPR